ncbi:hypothetical protein BDZ89DRAFT_941610 [Hymenopellis radicata]|nr:hypothetical protein BDZ89DRAFT_941610 [Hymenopellis radicata]
MNQHVLPHLDLFQIIKLSTCNEKVRGICDSYLEDHDPFVMMIAPFMPRADAETFRELLAYTHAVVSGSSALAYFNLCHFPSADLDIYAQYSMVATIGIFFLARGYLFVPHRYQRFGFGSLLSFTSPDDYPGFAPSYLTSTIVDVFNFRHSLTGKMVQIIAVRLSFMHIILEFHSTVVMCFVDAFRAVYLYPRLTFLHHVNIGNTMTGERETDARTKYVARGWPLLDDRAAVFMAGAHLGRIRVLGDGWCWIHRLMGVSPEMAAMEPLIPHSWSIQVQPLHPTFRMQLDIVHRHEMKITYCMDRTVSTWVRCITKMGMSLKVSIDELRYLKCLEAAKLSTQLRCLEYRFGGKACLNWPYVALGGLEGSSTLLQDALSCADI